MMNDRIIPLPPRLRRTAAELFARTYRADPSVGALFGDVTHPAFDRVLADYFDELFRMALKHGIVTCVMEGETLAAASIAYGPGAYPVPFVSSLMSSLRIARSVTRVPGGLRKLPRMGRLVAGLEAGHPNAAHFYGEIGCVDARFQRQGYAAMLLKDLLARADQARCGFYMETSNPANVPIWSKFGLRTVADREIEGVRYWSMWREPQLRSVSEPRRPLCLGLSETSAASKNPGENERTTVSPVCGLLAK